MCGITTGKVFSGIVGTSGARREFSILGDKVNLAARLMGHAKKKKKWNIVCGPDLVNIAQNKLSFKYIDAVIFKGKSIPVRFFIPVKEDPPS